MGMFKHILVRAHHGDKEAVDKLYEQYKPLLRKYSFVNGVFDEDLHHRINIRQQSHQSNGLGTESRTRCSFQCLLDFAYLVQSCLILGAFFG